MDSLLGNFGDDRDIDIVSESAEYSQKSDFSKARVIEHMIMKCIEAGSKEMKQGYYNYVFKNEVLNKIWIPDTREEFIGCVKTLRDLLSPELSDKENETFKAQELVINEKMMEVFNKYAYTENGTKRIPFTDEAVYIIKEKKIGDRLVAVKELSPGAWNDKVNNYKNELVLLYRELFSLLNRLIHNLNYFKRTLSF